MMRAVAFLKIILISHAHDWLQFGFDSYRSGYNPTEDVITISKFANNMLTDSWEKSFIGSSFSQPLYADYVLIEDKRYKLVFITTTLGEVFAVDASSGDVMWKKSIGIFSGSGCSQGADSLGSPTAFIDKSSFSLYIVSSDGSLHRLLLSTGEYYSSHWPIMGIFDADEFQCFGAINQYSNILYVAVSSRCSQSENSKSQLLSFEIDSMTSVVYTNSFSPAISLSQSDYGYSGGVIVGSGGVSIAAGYTLPSTPTLYIATQKIQLNNGVSSYGESIISMDIGLNMHNSYSPSSDSEDFATTPIIIFPTNGCQQTLIASINTAGQLYVTNIDLKSVQTIALMSAAVPNGFTLTAPAYDNSRNMLFVTTPEGALLAYSMNDYCSLSLSWRHYLVDGEPSAVQLSSPTVAGGIVYVSSSTLNEVFGVNADIGGFLWRCPGYGNVAVAPTVVDGMILILNTQSGVHGDALTLTSFTLTARGAAVQTTDSEQSTYRQEDVSDSLSADADVAYYSYPVNDDTLNLGDDFGVTIGGTSYDLTVIGSIGKVTKKGIVANDAIQRVFQFKGTDLSGNEYLYFFRLPIAGKPAYTKAMNNIGLNWFSPSITDAYQTDSDGIIQNYLGSYSASSWQVFPGGRLYVQYLDGQFCPRGNGYNRELSVMFSCSSSSVITYAYFEKPACIHHVNVSSSLFCTVTQTRSPTTRPTSDPSRNPTRSPTSTPSLRPTVQPSIRPSPAPQSAPVTHQPSQVPIVSPRFQPSRTPSRLPTPRPLVGSAEPSTEPSMYPTVEPSVPPSSEPTISLHPTEIPTGKPTFDPTVSFLPTGRPTVKPTEFPTTTFSPTGLGTVSVPSSTPVRPSPSQVTTVPPSPSLEVCITIAGMDSFGDGWDNARLMVMPSTSEPYSLSPGCNSGVVITKYCFSPRRHKSGDFVVIGVVGYKPAHFWEIFWQARDERSGEVYSGSYTTTMTFVYQSEMASLGSVTMVNQLPNDIECKRCESQVENKDVNGFLSDVLFTKADNMKKKEEVVSEAHRRSVGSLFDMHTNDPAHIAYQPIEIGRGAIGGFISFAIYGAEDAWESSEGYGNSFFIFDATGQHLYYSGNLCGFKDEGSCAVNLPDGEYIWRVSSAGGSNVFWSFCGVTAGSKSQLHFAWGNNQCNAVNLKSVDVLCKALSSSVDTMEVIVEQNGAEANSAVVITTDVVIGGLLRLGHMSSSTLSIVDQDILATAIALELSAAGPDIVVSKDQVAVLSVSSIGQDLVVAFQVRLSSNQFGGQSMSSSMQRDILASDIEEYLERSMDSGMFMARIRSLQSSAENQGSNLDLLTYIQVTTMHVETTSLQASANSSFPSKTVFGALVICSAVLALATYFFRSERSSQSYEQLSLVESLSEGAENQLKSLHEKLSEFSIQMGLSRSMAVSNV